MNKAIFAAGCFWHIQEIYDSLKGVIKTSVGYTGGNTVDPTYEEVCNGGSNHSEAIEVLFDEKIISYEDLLNQFWTIHDPTTLNRQGPDIGTQYRSAIYYTNNSQKIIAEESRIKMNTDKFKGQIVTEITQASTFYFAEEYHQNYNKKMKEQYGIS
jgi:peptide-methionine (S)-S-oxide reductase